MYSPAHEKANVLTHLAGVLFCLLAMPILIHQVVSQLQDWWVEAIGVALYAVGFMMVFAFSTLYHHQGQPERKFVLKVWDHVSIYYLIAGTYTPLLLHYATPEVATYMLLIVWGMALFGTIFKVFFTGRFRLVSTLIYLIMGWLIVGSPASFRNALPAEQVGWIAAGGACFTLGVVFYLIRRIPFHHAIWHVLVLAGAVCHYFAIYTIFA